MDFIPQSPADREAMLETLGLDSVETLLDQIPDEARSDQACDLPGPMTEQQLRQHMEQVGAKNRTGANLVSFAGGGVYERFIPAVVTDVIQRPEFITPYTPYQAEASQGTLEALFAYQSMVCELTGMDVANASLYDGASATAEAALMASDVTGRGRILASRALSPATRRVIKTYGEAAGVEIETVAFEKASGQTDLDALNDEISDDVCCVIFQQPNYFGILEQMSEGSSAAHEAGALFISVVEPISLGVLQPPGAYDADIAVGEGQPLGLPPSFGGPLLGIFACKQEFLRHMPGRIVGETEDVNGERGYCLTLQAREQHIRRQRATSNICTSQTLCAIAAAVYLAALGLDGLREIATISARRAHLLAERLQNTGNCLRFSGDFMNEFALQVSDDGSRKVRDLSEQGYLVGPALGREYAELDDSILLAVTEQRSVGQIDGLVSALAE